MGIFGRIQNRIKRERNHAINQHRVQRLRNLIKNEMKKDSRQTVIFFNASTRLSGVSQNAGFSLVSALVLEARGLNVVQLVCERGMGHCVLGTNNNRLQSPPPCAECIRTSRSIFDYRNVRLLNFQRDLAIGQALSAMSLGQLLEYAAGDFPVGTLILPSLRWILRRHHLIDDEDTRYLAREYILSALSLKMQFEKIVDDIVPLAVVVFNGMFYPEATLRWVAQKRCLPVFSHEVGMLPLSAFFTDQEATAYPVRIDDGFQLTKEQNRVLDDFLAKRVQGKFVTAGIQFWPEMKSLDDHFLAKVAQFKAMVPIFTNVVFDTSQSHANVDFKHMFEWLDAVLAAIKVNPDILFVIRAHPDELRPGKESRETVEQWIETNGVEKLPNVTFIAPDRYVSSYELIEQAKFVMVYNSTIGLEASILGKPVLCGGKARYTQIPTVFFPQSQDEYYRQLSEFSGADKIEQPEYFKLNARRVLYSQLFRASLPFDAFLEEDGVWRGYVNLKEFSLADLSPEKSPTIQVILDGIQRHKPFIREI
jgi:hypothetical protein